MCNEDFDCEDGTDEDKCDIVSPPCGGAKPESSEEGRLVRQGTLDGIYKLNPFNNDYYNGRCNTVRNPSTGMQERLPWNVEFFNYETLVEETTSINIFEDASSLFKEMRGLCMSMARFQPHVSCLMEELM